MSKISFKNAHIDMSHGAGGKAMAQLIDQLFIAIFDNAKLAKKDDQACFPVQQGRMVMATDSHVISPLFFPGGNIGSLAVNGTINDIAMSGATPLYMSASFILEEGFPLSDLKRIVTSMAITAKQAGIEIITGDTKVVEKGKGDGVFINTTAIGSVPDGVNISADRATPGDKVLISGEIGNHGVAVMSQRENLSFHAAIKSDTSALHHLTASMVKQVPDIHCLRDPTRGGLAACLNEWAIQSKVGMIIDEKALPIATEVKGACELLGLDPLYVANEGICVAICAPQDAERLLQTMRTHPQGKQAAIIGKVIDDSEQFVQMQTAFGGSRIINWIVGEQLPRIC